MKVRLLLVALVLLVLPAPAQAASLGVDAGDFFFKPYRVRVETGDTVTWRVLPGAEHTVTTRKAAPVRFDSATKEPGQTFPYTFTTPGRYPYLCTIHPGQEGVVQVGPDTLDPALTKLKARRGSKKVRLSFRLSEEAKVKVTITRAGKRVKTIRTKLLREGPRSVVYRPAELKPGSYRAKLVATDIEGNAADPERKAFAVPEPKG